MSGPTRSFLRPDWRGHRYLALGARLYLAGIFLWAAVPKIADPDLFALQTSAYELLPIPVVAVVAHLLPWSEVVVALALIAGIGSRWAAVTAAALLAVFMLAMASALWRGIALSCGCFGAGSDTVGTRMLLYDGAWLLLALYVAHFDRRPIGIAPNNDAGQA